jgi:hypothetical protein
MKASWMVGRIAVVVALLGLSACGSVEGTGGNDVPQGPAVPCAGCEAGSSCTKDGTGVNAVVTPTIDASGAAVQGELSIPQQGLDPGVAVCFDYTTQQFTAPALSLTQMAFTIRDGVLQVPPSDSVTIATQWFEWGEPTPGNCTAEVEAVVNVDNGTDSKCSVALGFGTFVDAPIGTYTVSSS